MLTKIEARKLLAESSRRRNLMYVLIETLEKLQQNSQGVEEIIPAYAQHIAKTKDLIAKSSANMGKLMEIVSAKG